jgi:hypothetical protein
LREFVRSGERVPVGRAAVGVGLRRHQRLHERGQHRAQQVRLGPLQVLGHKRGQVTTVGVDGHRDDLLLETLVGLLKVHAVAVFTSYDTLVSKDSYTTSVGLSAASR